MKFENKLVAILNKDIEIGVAMNALAHMAVGLGAHIGKDLLHLDIYRDANTNAYPNISRIPFIILKAKTSEIRKTVMLARESKIEHTIFLNTMTEGTYLEQIERTKNSPEEVLTYYGCVLFGAWEEVSKITKKFSLWK